MIRVIIVNPEPKKIECVKTTEKNGRVEIKAIFNYVINQNTIEKTYTNENNEEIRNNITEYEIAQYDFEASNDLRILDNFELYLKNRYQEMQESIIQDAQRLNAASMIKTINF